MKYEIKEIEIKNKLK